ncbi:MAG: hypothetical protein ABI373_11165 [Flavobacteriales bacterium]
MFTSSTLPSTLPPVASPETARSLKAFGHVEVLRIKRRSRKQPDLLLFKGTPGAKHSTVHSVLVTLAEFEGEAPAPYYDREAERIHLHYSSADDPELQALLADPGSFMCYCWTSFDGAHSHAWLLRMS